MAILKFQNDSVLCEVDIKIASAACSPEEQLFQLAVWLQTGGVQDARQRVTSLQKYSFTWMHWRNELHGYGELLYQPPGKARGRTGVRGVLGSTATYRMLTGERGEGLGIARARVGASKR